MIKRKSGKKVFLLKRRVYVYAAALIFAAVLLFIAIFSIKGKSELIFYYSPSESGAVVVAGADVQRSVIPGNSIARIRYSKDKTSGAVLMSNGSSYSLYDVKQHSSHLITDKSTSNYVVSHSGSAIGYITSESFLYSYDVSARRSEKIDEGVLTVAVSPNGKAFLYTKLQDGISKLYLHLNGKNVFLADGYSPLAVSDSANYIYVLSADKSLFMLSKDGSSSAEICQNCDTDMFCLSSNMEQIVFSDGEYTYISSQGKSRIRLTSGKSVPSFTASVATLCNSSGNVYTHTEKTLNGMVYAGADGVENYSLYFIDKNYVRTDISSGVAEYTVTDMGLVYRKSNGEVCSYKNGTIANIAKNATAMCAASDGSYIYYACGAELYVNHRQESVLLANGMTKMYMAQNNRLYFIMSDKKLYSVKRANHGELIDENVYSCKCNADSVYYSKNYSSRTGAFELYGNRGKGDFVFIASDITKI